MNKNIRYLFCPFTEQSYAVVKAMIKLDIRVDVVAAKGSGYVGKSIGYSVNRLEPQQVIKSIDEIDIKNYDILILPEDVNYIYYKDEIEILLEQVEKNNLEVYYCGKDDRLYEIFKDISIKKIDSTEEIFSYLDRAKALNELPLFQSKVPIIYIGGLMETKDSFDIGLQLKIELEMQKYTCVLVSQYNEGMLLGAVPYPPQFMGDQSTVEEQIVLFNRWIEAIDYCHRPDLIILDIPKGMMQYSRSLHNSFGIYAQMMSATLPPDFLILTILKDNIDEEQLENINQHFNKKLGKDVDIFHVVNSTFKISPNESSISEKPLFIKEEKIKKAIDSMSNTFKDKFINLSSSSEIERLVDILISKFS